MRHLLSGSAGDDNWGPRRRQALRDVWVRNGVICWVSFLLPHSGQAGALPCWLTDSQRVTMRPQASQRYSYRGMADPPFAGATCMVSAPRSIVKLVRTCRGRTVKRVVDRAVVVEAGWAGASGPPPLHRSGPRCRVIRSGAEGRERNSRPWAILVLAL